MSLRESTPSDREAVEAFICERFRHSHGSKIKSFMPRLLSLQRADNQICGAFGVRRAASPLFLEQYLDESIEAAIAAHTGTYCERANIAEVGHLTGAFPGVVRLMIAMATQRLRDEGVRWVCFTGTGALRNAFHRMGLDPIAIADARAHCLPEADRADWGRYYDDAPRVYIGDVHTGQSLLGGGVRPMLVKDAAP